MRRGRFVFRRNLIPVFMSIELIGTRVNLCFVAFSTAPEVTAHLCVLRHGVGCGPKRQLGWLSSTVFKNRVTLEIDGVTT